jgi:hypothetical protein
MQRTLESNLVVVGGGAVEAALSIFLEVTVFYVRSKH